MSYRPPPSPPLPTFAIKDLCGPSNPPGLISISKRRYDATIKSTPDAALLYLDDDDGELITVGSSLELGQRLEEPVPKYIRELRDPADGKLVHVFDINHSLASLIEWRDHEAYSSKRFNSLSSPFQTPRPDSDSIPRCLSPSLATPHITYPNLPEPRAEEFTSSCTVNATVVEDLPSTQKQPAQEPLNILDGIEEHLSGLANVLQIAANTLQKAADKTQETDTSVIEDILKGVKGILTEVGSFGVEAFKDLGAEIKTTASEQSTQNPLGGFEKVTADIKEEIAAQLAQEAKEEHDLRNARKENQSPEEALESSVYYNVEVVPPEDAATKVKFVLPEEPAQKKPVPLDETRPIPIHARSARPDESCPLNIVDDVPASKLQSPSFLDDSSEDADFTARYPPLSTVRRSRSTIEQSLHSLMAERKERSRAMRRYFHPHVDVKRESSPGTTRGGPSSTFSPFASPPSRVADEITTVDKAAPEDKTEHTNVAQKPLPGAWPDVKNDAVPSPPTHRESSGDFFNRMVGRGRPDRYRAPLPDSGLHRANTTASSNPASRLNGPFDPGFPYDPSPSSSHRPGPFRPYRAHRRSASPSQNCHSLFPAAPLEPGKRPSLASGSSLLPSRSTARNFGTPADTQSVNSSEGSRSQFESHRAVKHHRSVPQFHVPPLPYQIMKPRPVGNETFRPMQRSTTDFFSGPPMPMPPPMPFTARPAFAPRSVPPNLWAPWQSSPPTQPPADEGTNVSSLNDFTTNNNATSPVSPQDTLNKDIGIPSNSPPWPSAQPQPQPASPPSPSMYRYPTPPRPGPVPALPTFWPPPPTLEPLQLEPVKDKIDECVEQLKMCGFGVDDENLKNRLHVYAVAADGDVTEAVEMIEQDRRMTAPGRFDSV